MSYTLILSDKERGDLAWFADRGYDCGLYDALEMVNSEVSGYGEDYTAYVIPEYKAWEIMEQNEEHGAWSCLNWESPLGVKISKFLESII